MSSSCPTTTHPRSSSTRESPLARVGAGRSAGADALHVLLVEIGRHKLLTAAEEVAVAKRLEQGDLLAKRRMIESNLRLVVSIAKGYRGLDVAFHDPLNVGGGQTGWRR